MAVDGGARRELSALHGEDGAVRGRKEMAKRLTGHHLKNIDRAVSDLSYLHWNNEDSLKEELKKILKSDDRLTRLLTDIHYLNTVRDALLDVELL
jgi:hypothetical protein